jgi:hypothetical protein
MPMGANRGMPAAACVRHPQSDRNAGHAEAARQSGASGGALRFAGARIDGGGFR